MFLFLVTYFSLHSFCSIVCHQPDTVLNLAFQKEDFKKRAQKTKVDNQKSKQRVSVGMAKKRFIHIFNQSMFKWEKIKPRYLCQNKREINLLGNDNNNNNLVKLTWPLFLAK